jgi:hypothetical protein
MNGSGSEGSRPGSRPGSRHGLKVAPFLASPYPFDLMDSRSSRINLRRTVVFIP